MINQDELRERLIDAIKKTMKGKLEVVSEIGIALHTFNEFMLGNKPASWKTLGKIRSWVEKAQKDYENRNNV